MPAARPAWVPFQDETWVPLQSELTLSLSRIAPTSYSRHSGARQHRSYTGATWRLLAREGRQSVSIARWSFGLCTDNPGLGGARADLDDASLACQHRVVPSALSSHIDVRCEAQRLIGNPLWRARPVIGVLGRHGVGATVTAAPPQCPPEPPANSGRFSTSARCGRVQLARSPLIAIVALCKGGCALCDRRLPLLARTTGNQRRRRSQSLRRQDREGRCRPRPLPITSRASGASAPQRWRPG